jgi:hypothetical protein
MNREAAAHLEFFLEKQTKATPKQIAEVKKSLDKVLPKVAKLTVLPSPDDSDVFVDDVLVGRGRQTVFLNPGDARIGAAKDGQSISKTVSVKAGEVIGEYRIEVPKEPTGQGGAGGAGAGGAAAGGAGGAGEGAGGAGGIAQGGGDTGPRDENGVAPWVGWLLGGSGLAAAGVGAALLGLGQAKLGEASEIGDQLRSERADCSSPTVNAAERCDEVEGLVGGAEAFTIGGAVLVATGAAALLGMVLVWTVGDDDSGKVSVTVVPWSEPHGAGLFFQGAF